MAIFRGNEPLKVASVLIDSPCIFCGYNGQGYWQKGTHSQDCPWHEVGGMKERTDDLPDLLHDMARAWMRRHE